MRAVVLLLVVATACSKSPEHRLLVRVLCVPAGAETLTATFDFGAGEIATETWSRESGFASEESFEAFLPHGGSLRVDIAAGGFTGGADATIPDDSQVTVGLGTDCDTGIDAGPLAPCPAGPPECTTNPFRCAGDPSPARCYTFCPLALSFDGAQSICRSWIGRGNLATVDSAEIMDCFAGHPAVPRGWIGLRQATSAGSPGEGWRWLSSGEEPAFFAWGVGPPAQPDDMPSAAEDGEEDCAYIFSNFTYAWFDGSCAMSQPFVCETDP